MTRIAVNPKVLTWARNEAHIDQDEAAHKIGVSVEDLIGFESGTLQPTLTQVRDMAKSYQLAVATLAMPEPFATTKMPKDFRTVRGKSQRITSETAFAIRQARRYQDELQDLYSDDEELAIEYATPDARPNDTPSILAIRERKRLNIAVDTQLSWGNDNQALREWRTRIEALGVSVFLLDMPVQDCRGFSLRETKNPVIVVSKREYTDAAKLFTLLHEYCHILKNRPGISNLNNRNKIEKFCNDFAAQILMPIEALSRVLALPPRPIRQDWGDAHIKFAARRLHVSQQAVALRLVNAGYAPKIFYDEFKERQPKLKFRTNRNTKGGPQPHVMKLSEVGATYAGQVLAGYARGVLNDVEAYRILDLAPKHFEKLRDSVEKRLPKYAATRFRF